MNEKINNDSIIEQEDLYKLVMDYVKCSYQNIDYHFIPRTLEEVDTDTYMEFLLINCLYQNSQISREEAIHLISLLFNFYYEKQKKSLYASDIVSSNIERNYNLLLLRISILNKAYLLNEIKKEEYIDGIKVLKKTYKENNVIFEENKHINCM